MWKNQPGPGRLNRTCASQLITYDNLEGLRHQPIYSLYTMKPSWFFMMPSGLLVPCLLVLNFHLCIWLICPLGKPAEGTARRALKVTEPIKGEEKADCKELLEKKETHGKTWRTLWNNMCLITAWSVLICFGGHHEGYVSINFYQQSQSIIGELHREHVELLHLMNSVIGPLLQLSYCCRYMCCSLVS